MRRAGRSVGQIIAAIILTIAATAPVSAGAPANPYDKFRNAAYSNDGLMSEQEERQLGAEAHRQVLQQYRLVQDPDVADYVQDLGERIAASSRRPNLRYQFFVIDDPTVNAFALPGGYVYVFTGLLQIATSEEELSAAIAHEIGHVVARHGLRNVKKAQRTALIFGILGAAGSVAAGGGSAGQAAEIAAQLLAAGVLTRNSRDFEREADFLGLYTMRAAGYQPSGMIDMFQRLNQAAASAKSSKGGGIFASHPDANERIRNTQTEISQHLGGPASAPGSRPRRARTGANPAPAPAPVAVANTAGFNRMKAAVGGNASRQYPNPNPRANPNRNDPYSQPAPNERPVLTRRP